MLLSKNPPAQARLHRDLEQSVQGPCNDPGPKGWPIMWMAWPCRSSGSVLLDRDSE
jgi:hypothetical protein